VVHLGLTRYLLLILILYPFSTYAEITNTNEIPLEELILLDIEELTTVSIASKVKEAIGDAPGIITVVKADEIQRYGARHLRDVIDRQTHMQVVGSNLLPHNRTSTRGVSLGYTETDVLLLLNGRPIRDAANSAANHDLYASFPIETIKQIEIIRGPGSVLYGTNAFSGVINIITKDIPDSPEANVSVSYGSFNSKKMTLSGGGKIGDFEFYGAVSGLNSVGDDFNNLNGEGASTGTYKTGFEGHNLVLNAKYKGFTLNAMSADSTRDHGKSTFTLPSADYNLERQYADIGYKHHFNENWNASVNYTYHHYRDDFELGQFGLLQFADSEDHLIELSSWIKLNDKLNMLSGGTYNLQHAKAELDAKDHTVQNLSAYLQADYQVFDWLKLIGGFQFNKPDDVDGEFSPRFSTIVKLNDEWGIKLLYGEAFRQATIVERFINVPNVLLGDTELKPETIETFDAQIHYRGKRSSFAATYFHSVHKNLITRTGAAPTLMVNSGEVKYDGFELEGKYDLGHGFNFIGNMSYQTNEKNDGAKDVTYSPDWMFKTGMSYDSPRGYQLSVFNSYFAKSTLQNHQVATVTASNPDAESYNLLTANLRVNMADVFNDNSLSNINFSLYGDNLLDEEIFFPSMNRTSVNSLPHHSGRGFYGTISIDF
jgi:outer membrane receptor protein involved in Fe transport